jgi:hypothetical protein
MRSLIVTGLLLLTSQVASAQLPAAVQPGTRVRVWIPERARQDQSPDHRQLLRGTVQSVDGGLVELAGRHLDGRREFASHNEISSARNLALLDPQRCL